MRKAAPGNETELSESYSLETDSVLTPVCNLRLFEMRVTTDIETRVRNTGHTCNEKQNIKIGKAR